MELFSDLISPFFQKRGSIREYVNTYCPELTEFKDIRTKERKIRRYIHNQAIPSYQEAKSIMINLDIYNGEDELLAILESTKASIDTQQYITQRNYNLFSNIKLSYSDLKDTFPEMSFEELKLMIQERIDTTTKSRTSKEYLARLIIKDLDEAILDIYKEDK